MTPNEKIEGPERAKKLAEESEELARIEECKALKRAERAEDERDTVITRLRTADAAWKLEVESEVDYYEDVLAKIPRIGRMPSWLAAVALYLLWWLGVLTGWIIGTAGDKWADKADGPFILTNVFVAMAIVALIWLTECKKRKQ